jgi:hypothetical protein
MTRTKEWRLHQKQRILNRRLHMERDNGWCYARVPNGNAWWDIKGNKRTLDNWDDVFEARYKFARKQINTHTPCSCHMCGNPRKHFNAPTIQEIKHRFSEINEFDEIGLRVLNFRYKKTSKF